LLCIQSCIGQILAMKLASEKKKGDAQKKLVELTLAEEEMSEMIEKGGVKVIKLEDWANIASNLAGDAGFRDGNLLILLVHTKFLEPILLKVEGEHQDWNEFMVSVRSVDKTYLKKKVEKAKKEGREREE
jgi:hypothetical protein